MAYKDRDRLIAEAMELRKEGMSYQKIANKIGVKDHKTVWYWLDPIAREKQNARSKKYHEEHRVEHRVHMKKWYAENAEHNRELKRQYYIEHKEEVKERVNRWYLNNKERCAKNKCNHRATHKDVYSAYAQIRDKKIKEYDNISQDQYGVIFERQKGLCIYCGKTMLITGDPNHPDYKTKEHIYPVIQNGAHVVENIVFACRSCNSSKNGRTVAEWKPELVSRIGNGVCGEQQE